MVELKLDLPPDITAEEATINLAIKLWEMERLSLGQAAQLAGYSKPAFMEILGKRSIALFNYPAEELSAEIE